MNNDTQSEELARIIEREYTRAIVRRRPTDAYDAPADAILAAGYRKPTILGYLVVDSAGNPVGGDFYEDRESAQGDADAWNDETFGPVPDGGYRVAEITEPAT